jgi:hypothetical protein
MGFVVGAIIVYQILFADVSEHLNEYATLRAIGYRNRFVSGIVLQQAVILGVLGYLPGLVVVYWLYGKAAAATNLPLYITQERAITVFLMTLGMCAISVLWQGGSEKTDPVRCSGRNTQGRDRHRYRTFRFRQNHHAHPGRRAAVGAGGQCPDTGA